MNIYKFSTEVFNGVKSNTKLVSTEEISIFEVNDQFGEMGVTNVLSGTINRDTDTLYLFGFICANSPEIAEIILQCWEVSENEKMRMRKELEEKLEEDTYYFNSIFSEAKEEWRNEKRKLEQELEELLDRLERIGV